MFPSRSNQTRYGAMRCAYCAVRGLEGQGPRTRVQVTFAGAGNEWPMPDMAGLTPA